MGIDEKRLTETMQLIEHELRRACERFPPYNSPHEGWAVIHEEVCELWEDVRSNAGRGGAATVEAIQVAAVAARYVLELGSL